MVTAAEREKILIVVALIFLAGCGSAVPGEPTSGDAITENDPTIPNPRAEHSNSTNQLISRKWSHDHA